MSGFYTKDGLCTKLGWQRTKGVYNSGKTKGGTILNPVTSAMRARYALMIKGSPK